MPLRPAIFWDRDGTLIEDRGHLSDPREAILFPGTFEALRRLQNKYLFFIVTNQPGVAEGKIGIADVECPRQADFDSRIGGEENTAS
jgi:D-glycero-D-manno-heptose 1,7-bisphosphate phosphatase